MGAPILRAVATLIAFTLIATIATARDLSSTIEIKIAAQPLASALLEFSAQTDVQIMTLGANVRDLKTPGIAGQMTVREALERLLQGSGLTFRLMGDSTVGLMRTIDQSTSGRDAFPNAPDRFRLAQANQGTPSNASNRENIAEEESAERSIALEEIVVTGSHIRGTAPIGSPLITVDRDEIERGAFSTAEQVLQSLPQNFGGGGIAQDSNLVLNNIFAGSAVNLRGLGTGSTLTLINGRRLPASGLNGDYADISSIPLTAVERIEVMPDGASAIYGSDAIGGVVNFILRRDFDGLETRARYGSVTDGNAPEIRVGQLFGTTWKSGHAFATYEYYRRDSLAAADRDFASDSDLTEYGGNNFGNVRSNPGNITVTGVGTFAISL